MIWDGIVVHENPKSFFSTVECACGCGNLLTQKALDNGCKFIWGHKKHLNGKVHDKALVGHKQIAPKVKTISNTNMESIESFFTAQLNLIRTHITEQTASKDNALDRIKTLSYKEAKVIRILEALKEL